MNVPNSLTLFRIAIIPVFVGLFYADAPWVNEAVTGLFIAAAVTDWLDGFLARKLKQTSAFGAFLDPVADKLMVAAALVLLVQADPRALTAIPAVVIIGREIAISALREWMAELGQRSTVRVAMLGKLKTLAQMLSITLLLYGREQDTNFYDTGLVLLYIATVMTLWSMALYLRAAWPLMRMDAPVGRDERQKTQAKTDQQANSEPES
jgi:CDP-diacylglycerol--glycerol-3-phosphate 3-phosphatidyltransferase